MRYALELFYEVEGVCYGEELNEQTREILRNYVARKSLSVPSVYVNVSYMCNEVNNNPEKTADNTLRFDAYMYTDKDVCDVLTVTYGNPATVHVNGKYVLSL